MLKRYSDFIGSRKELIDIISKLEKKHPEKYMMFSKKNKKYLPINLRRLQQFTDQGLLPNGQIINKLYQYNFDHLLRYIAIMKLKNDGYTLLQTERILKDYDAVKLLDFVDYDKNNKSEIIDHRNIKEKNDLAEKLIKLGRGEGRVLRSQWIRFAITKWCNCEVKKKELNTLNIEDVKTLTEAFRDSLLATIQIENIDQKIK